MQSVGSLTKQEEEDLSLDCPPSLPSSLLPSPPSPSLPLKVQTWKEEDKQNRHSPVFSIPLELSGFS